MTLSYRVFNSLSEETVTCPEDEDVFCIAVKEEPDDDADEGPVELSNDHPEEVQEAHFPSDDTLNINTAVQVEVNEPDSVQETSVSGTGEEWTRTTNFIRTVFGVKLLFVSNLCHIGQWSYLAF